MSNNLLGLLMKRLMSLLLTSLFSLSASANTGHDINQYFASILSNKSALMKFLADMPKGADLHNHLAGASYAENLIADETSNNFCINDKDDSAVRNTKCQSNHWVYQLALNAPLYNRVIDSWSMRNMDPTKGNMHDHFFSAFSKFSALSSAHRSEILAEAMQRAADEHTLYLELMYTVDDSKAPQLAKNMTWSTNFAQMRSQLFQLGINKIVSAIPATLTTMTDQARTELGCDTNPDKTACHVKVRYLCQIGRQMPPQQVFAQMLMAFELASRDSRVSGLNLVQAEDNPSALRNYDLQMQMLDYLHSVYPKVNISLHAGELTPLVVAPQYLHNHIRAAILTGHAQRIGHGIDIEGEDNYQDTLNKMAQNHILVEINLTSNDDILGVSGTQHPLPVYLQNNVPVALSTDDEGVLRTDLTDEYTRAAQSYSLSYATIKQMDRNSLTYSFAPGESLWLDADAATPVTACAKDTLGSNAPSGACKTFLAKNEKASLQWQLESDFSKFEQPYK